MNFQFMEIHNDYIESNILKNNPLNDEFKREIIRIENNIDDNTPVFIGLAGFFGSSRSFMNKSYTNIDFYGILKILKEKYGFIFILPDTMTYYRGNQYVNSPAVGNYEDFLTTEVVNYIMEKYGKRDIFLFGKSSGGFGSIMLSIRHGDIFKGFIDISGDSYFTYSYMQDFPAAYSVLKKNGLKVFLNEFNNKFIHTQDELTAMNIIAMSAFYSFNDKDFDLPFNLTDGSINEEIWNKWLSYDPVKVLQQKFRNIEGKKIILQTGIYDEYKMYIGMNMIHNILNEKNIEHKYMEYPAGHFNTNHFYLDSFPEILKNY